VTVRWRAGDETLHCFAMCRLHLVIPLVFAACAAADPTIDPNVGKNVDRAPTAAEPASWQDVMQQVDALCDELEAGLARGPRGELAPVATASERAAGYLRLGYGRFEDARVPGFARMARDAESWLLQVALEARQDHGDIAADLFQSGRQRHCADCHDAHDRVHG
jgi:hypothetical protein